jgi:two-component sensor histidine kinase
MLRIIIRRSAATDREPETYVAHLEDRLDTLARAQAAADEHGSVELHNLLADELLHYGASDGDRVTLDGPDVHLMPRVGQIMAMAFHELAVNSIEYGTLGFSTGGVNVRWSVSEGDHPQFTLTWKEHGHPGIPKPAREGFGTEILTRTLAYELKAETVLRFDADGLFYQVSFLLLDRFGSAETA